MRPNAKKPGIKVTLADLSPVRGSVRGGAKVSKVDAITIKQTAIFD